MRKSIICLLFLVAAISKINAQDVKFGWSLGDIGWSYNFIGEYDLAHYNLLNFNVSFEKINMMINTSLMSGSNKNNSDETEPSYNSFFPLEIIYTPFKWKYMDISVYGRGMWEIEYIEEFEDPISYGFFGSIGFRLGFIPIVSSFFKYRSNVVNIFTEYTLRNEYKLGVSLDLLDLVVLGLAAWRAEMEEKKNENNSY